MQRLVQPMVSDKIIEKMIMEEQRKGSEECHRGKMTDKVREREIAVMKVQLLQEQENQKGGWIFPLKGKRVIWKPLQMRLRQREIALLKEELRVLELEMEFEDYTCRSV